MLIKKVDSLTDVDLRCGGAPRETHLGMAHFADPSIVGSCGGCAHHMCKDTRSEKRYCDKARQQAGKWLSPVPKAAQACKYFEKAKRPSGGCSVSTPASPRSPLPHTKETRRDGE